MTQSQVDTRNCRECSSEFRIDPDDFSFYEKMGVSAPALCPECRFVRRTVWRNERTLYRRDCQLCGRSVVSMYHPESPYTVYCFECWHSDKWDPYSYAQDYDSTRPFLEQLNELMLAVPKSATYIGLALGQSINSEYTNFTGGNKDSYLIFNSGPNAENCGYSRGLQNCRDVYDVYFAESAERAYEGVNIEKSAGVAFGQNAVDCIDSWFLRDCTGVQRCFGCVNLRHGSYKFFNEQLDKEEWARRTEPLLGSYKAWQEIRERFEEHGLKFPRRENTSFKCTDSTGNYLYECKNCKNCFEVAGSENLRHCFAVKGAKDCYDILGHGRRSELMLECVAVGVSSNMIGCWCCESSHDLEYCLDTRGSEYCFGSVGIQKGSYCILNKRYGQQEYERLRQKLIAELTESGDYGLSLPPRLAPFAYNEGVGQDNKPLSKEEALGRGFRWQEDIPQTRGQETMKAEDIPDRIQDVEDGILEEILACTACGRNHRLIKAELEMYRKALIPVPRRCFSCRHEDRIRRRGPMELYDRTCAKCSKSIQTPYAPDRPEIVYCEQCYQQEVV